MNSLAGILRQNELDQTRKAARRARALNNPVGNPKDAEKGRPCKRTLPARLAKVPAGACRGLDKLR